ncbi:hypothetical protein MMC10_008479 [Thelotrema lepadinum]|nr:hypothetical protein [Thelotrema lepadinum]
MASLNLAIFRLPSGELRQMIYLHRDDQHQLYDLKPEQDFFLTRIVTKDPKSFSEWESTTYIASIPSGMLPRFIEMLHETMGGLLDDDVDYVDVVKDLAGSMTIMQEGDCSALLCLEDLLLEQVLKIQLQVLARLLRAEVLPGGYEEQSISVDDLSETIRTMLDINAGDSPTLGQFDQF